MTSTSSSSASRNAASPSSASPTTSMSGARSTTVRKPSRNTGWSSTIRTRSGGVSVIRLILILPAAAYTLPLIPDSIGTSVPGGRERSDGRFVYRRDDAAPTSRSRHAHPTVPAFSPLSGIIFSLLFAAATLLTKNEPSETASAAKVFTYWHGHQTAENVTSFLLIPLAAFFLLLFGAGLRAALRSGEAGEASYSAVAYAGAIFAAAGFGASPCSAGRQRAAPTRCDVDGLHAQPAELVRLGHLDGGVCGNAHRSRPWWPPHPRAAPRPVVGAIPVGIAFVTPAGEIAFFVLPFWVLATSIALHRRGRDLPATQARLIEQPA